MTTSPFFHAIVCSGNRSDYRIEAHGSRSDTLRGAIERVACYVNGLRDENPHADLFLRTFRVVDGKGTEVDPDTGEALEA